jgi:hypothetical protein
LPTTRRSRPFPASLYARDYKKAIAARLAETAHEAGAANPEQLGEQLALLLDGASARTRVLNAESFPDRRRHRRRSHRQRHPATARRSANTTAG